MSMRRVLTLLAACLVCWGTTNAAADESGSVWPVELETQHWPGAYWWCPGSALDEKNIDWNLETLFEGGIRNVHHIPIYGARGYEDRYLDYLSPQYVAMLDYAVRKAESLGMNLDTTTGTGWCFGGPDLAEEHKDTKAEYRDGTLTLIRKRMVKRPAPGGEGGDDYFERSKFVHVPDAIGDLLRSAPAPAQADGAPPAAPLPTRRRRRGGVSPLGVMVTVVIVGGITAMVVLKRDPNEPSATRAPDTSDAPAAAKKSALEEAVAEAVPALPSAKHIDAVVDTVWLVAGPEALRTSIGAVPGVASNRPPLSAFRRDDRGTWLPAMRQALSRAGGPARDQLSMALDAGTPASSLLRFAYSGHLAGFNRFSILVRREDRPDRLTAIDFSIDLPEHARPSAGVAVVRVGRLGVRVSVESRDGERLTPVDAVVPRTAGSVDIPTLERVLTELTKRHRAVRVAIVYLDPDMTLAQVVPLLVRLREAQDRDRFPSLRLAPG